MLKLIIAEKPSLGRNIASAIGTMSKGDGFLENNEYIVTWAYGHLFQLLNVEDYVGEKLRWSEDNLPFYPEKFKYKLSSADGVAKQFGVVKKLMNRSDVSEIINAGDADREGEIIVRNIIKLGLTSAKPIKRLWLPDQTKETVRAALKDLKDDSEYDSLANEGWARTYVDWLYGINLTRLATVKGAGQLYRVGRVIAPVVKAIYDRDKSIENFKSKTYYGVASKNLTSKETFDTKEEAEKYAEKLNAETIKVTSKTAKRTTLSPGKLYSLSKLQNYLGKRYKMKMEISLATIQSLYEKGYLTYPRTNSEYLATAEKENAKKIITAIAPLRSAKFRDSKYIFDDSKIESHSALTPTTSVPEKSKISDAEWNVYETVLNRFAAVFYDKECILDKTEMLVKAGDVEEFKLQGTIVVEPGWTKFDGYVTASDKVIPNWNEGDEVSETFAAVEKQTSPPKHYTIETLNNYLKNPFSEDKKLSEEEEYKMMFEGVELGTEATRTGIIKNACDSGYITLNKDVYYITDVGKDLIEVLEQIGIKMDKYKSVEMSKTLKSVYRGEKTISDAINEVKSEITEIVTTAKDKQVVTNAAAGDAQVLGKCPLCGNPITKQKFSYTCKRDCTFSLPFELLGHKVSVTEVKQLLNEGRTSKKAKYTSKKTGKKFESYLKLNEGKIEFDFSGGETAKEALDNVCVCCGNGKMVSGKYSYECTTEGCEFKLPYELLGHKLTKKECEDLLTKKTTSSPAKFVSRKTGKKFEAFLIVDDNNKIQFSFPDTK